MKINLVTVGNLKEKYLIDALNEYKKRIQRYHSISVVEVEEEKLPKNYSCADVSRCLVKEGQRILKNVSGYVVVLHLQGKEISSVDFAKLIDSVALKSDTITFVIGGSFGVSDEVKARADYLLAFSKMTFPHQLFRVMLLEQIYRAATITNNVQYHK